MILKAGAAFTNITPHKPHFLYGYPFVERISTGINDWLLSSALYLTDGVESVFFITNDIVLLSKAIVANVRKGISEATGVPADHIMVGATHTHSGPITIDCKVSADDSVIPPADQEYIRYMEQQIIRSACTAFSNAVLAKIGLTVADGTGIGTNRHDPDGPADLDIPVLVVKDLNDKMIACMMVCNMHPTVLHEDSTLCSGDFPSYARDILQKKVFGCECPVLHFTGASGNQSPRHVTRSNTFDEAARLGGIIAHAVKKSLDAGIEFDETATIICRQQLVDLPRREFPTVEWATTNRDRALEQFETLKKMSGSPQEIRTAEVDWFGAEELLFLSTLINEGALEETYRNSLPAEIQMIKIGRWTFVSWSCEAFIEYELQLKSMYKDTFLATLTNGELQGYVVTEEAVRKNYYEASNSLFHYSSGEVLLSETIKLLNQ